MKPVRALLLLCVLAPGLATPVQAYDVGLVVPVFSGPRQLARNVSTTLYLQVWRTLRRKPWPNPRNLDFGSGIARYDPGDAFQPTNAREIFDYVRGSEVQLLLWGSAKPLGDGVVVQAFLGAPAGAFGGGSPEQWRIDHAGRSVSLDLPRRTFDFDPIVLSRQLIAYYTAQEGLQMCSRPALPCDAMPVGNDWVALEHNGDWAAIRATASGQTGWLHLPSLDRMPNDASDFSAALTAYYRKDYGQAERFFQRVASRPEGQSSTRQDARVLALIAAARDGRTNLAAFDLLSRQNPDALYLFQALVMARLTTAIRAPASSKAAEFARIFSLVDRNRQFFAEDDPWLRQIDQMARASR